jgi:hypothetical protein
VVIRPPDEWISRTIYSTVAKGRDESVGRETDYSGASASNVFLNWPQFRCFENCSGRGIGPVAVLVVRSNMHASDVSCTTSVETCQFTYHGIGSDPWHGAVNRNWLDNRFVEHRRDLGSSTLCSTGVACVTQPWREAKLFCCMCFIVCWWVGGGGIRPSSCCDVFRHICPFLYSDVFRVRQYEVR